MQDLRSLPIESVQECELCGDSPVRDDESFARLLGLQQPYAVACCQQCGLRWLSPRPSAEGYAEIYRFDHYFAGEGAVEQYDELLNGRRRYFADRLDSIRQLFEQNSTISILDIGAATGEFVQEARKRQMDATGIELSEGARATAFQRYGIELLACEMDSLEGGRFDVIHMNHVLEHLPSPLAALRSCQRLLREGGYVVLEVPQQLLNDLDRAKRLFGKGNAAFNIYSLHHTYFYNPSNFRFLLEKAGFDVQSLATANSSRTPITPFSLKNAALRVFLGVADLLHQGGNIIEVYARKR